MNKCTYISLSTRELDYDCISINETWLHPSHNNEEFIHEKYNVFRKDRKNTNVDAQRGGGVLLAINKKFDCEEVSFPEIKHIEAICIRVTFESSHLYIYSLYIRNRTNVEPDITTNRYADHVKALTVLNTMCSPTDTIIVLGDFNLPSVNWLSDEHSAINSSNDYGYIPIIGQSDSADTKISVHTTSSLIEMGLHQMCNFKNKSGNILDLIYTNTPELLSVDRAELTLFPDCMRDPAHNAILCTFECAPLAHNSTTNEMPRFCFRKANFDELNETLGAINFSDMFIDKNVDQMVESFYDTLHNVFEHHVPQATPKINNIPVWYDKKLLNLRNVRNREHKKLQLRRVSDINYSDAKFINAKNDFESYQKELYTEYVKKLAHDRHNNPKMFWRYINGKRSSNSLPTKLKYNDKTATTDTEKANLFAEFFSSVYVDHKDNTDIRSFIHNRNDSGFNNFRVNEEAVYNIAMGLDLSKGCGPDNIPPILIKKCAETLCAPLTMIYSKSIKDCVYPDKWKVGQITPIFKSGSKSDVSNYRGVNVLSNFAKMFEYVIYNQLKLIIFPRLSKTQHGFMPNRNIATNLLELTSVIYSAFEKRCQVDVFYADIKKAFDTVNQILLLLKMANFPLANSILKWFLSYFENRRQLVKVGSSKSSTFNVPSSVGQGSVLGPLLFLIFFDDSDSDLLDSLVFNFADDKKIVQVISDPNDTQILQNSINKFIKWCNNNDLSVNVMKCSVMTFSTKNNTIHANYYINDNQILRVYSARDLGVIFDSKLSFASHIEYVTNKAHTILAFVKRHCYKTFNSDIAKMLYYALVRSIIEFANMVWSPHQAKYISALESIQKQLVKFIHPSNSANNPNNQYALRPYYERCNDLGIQTLCRRRINQCIFFLHDIITGRLKSSPLRDQLSFVTINHFTRNFEFIKINRCRLSITQNSPFRSACGLYNLVALYVDVTSNRDTFRKQITRLPDSLFEKFYCN